MSVEAPAQAQEKRLVLYPWQARAIAQSQPTADRRWFAWFCGTGAGKTYAGALWALQQQIAAAQRLAADDLSRRKRPVGLVVAPTFDSLRRYAVGHLLEHTAGTRHAVRYFENRHDVIFPPAAGGGHAVCCSFDNPATVKRAEGGQFDWAWIDEAGQTPDAAYAVVRARTAIRRAPVLLTSYWYAPINWCYREIWRRWEAGDAELGVLNLPTWENPDYPKQEIEAARRTLDRALFEMRYEAKPSRMVGLVYGESWQPGDPEMHCEPFDIPADWRVVVGGLDQGFSPSPFVLELLAEDPATGVLYAFAEFWSLATTTQEKAAGITALLRRTVPEAGSRHFDFFGDPANPQGLVDLRNEFRRLTGKLDISVHSADNAVESGIEAVVAALRGKRLRVMRGRCPHLVDELTLYCRDSHGNIVKRDDHAVDALRYVVYSRARRRQRAGVV